MSIITDALKLAASLEKTISKQENEIAKLKAQVESLTIAKAASDEEARGAKLALKEVKKTAKAELKEANQSGDAACLIVQQELHKVRRELRDALKTQKVPKAVVPTNDALGQVKRKPGRPKKVVEPEVPLVDPRQIPIPDLGAPAISADPAQTTSAKGVNYEFV
jgi:hypothetical protein